MIIFILLLATFLRVINLNQSLWLDEAINVVGAKEHSLISLITNYSIGDFHPPGYFVLLWFWTKIFGYSEVIVRAPSVILGVLTVWIAFLIGKKLFNKKVAILASLFLAIAPLHVYYSQEARMYALAAFAVSLSTYCFTKLINNEKNAKASFVLSSILVLYSDYLAYLIIPAQLFFLFWTRKKILKFIKTFSISLFLLIPWLPFFISQFKTGLETSALLTNWSDVVGGASIKNLALLFIKILFGRISIANKTFYSFISLAGFSLYALIFLKAAKKLDEQTKLLICWIIVPLFLAFVISSFVPVFIYFRVLFILPAIYLLLAKGVDTLKGLWFWASLTMVILISLISLSIFNVTPEYQRENWKEAVSSIKQKQDDRSLILLENNDIFAPIKYYSSDFSQFKPGIKKIPASQESDILGLDYLLKDKDKVYLFEYLIDITDPNRFLEKRLINLGFFKQNTLNFSGVGFVYVYTKI